MEIEGFDEGDDLANDSQYGLSAGIIIEELAEAHEFVDRSESVVVTVNEKTTGFEFQVPFAGIKNSLTNTQREQGDAAIDFFVQTKTVYLNH